MITDEQLDERADELTSLFGMVSYGGTFTNDPVRIYRNLKREALGVDRESLVLLELYRNERLIEMQTPSHRLDSHITTLRKRLGLTA